MFRSHCEYIYVTSINLVHEALVIEEPIVADYNVNEKEAAQSIQKPL